MGNLFNTSTMFENAGERPRYNWKREIFGGDSDVLVTGGLFTATNVATTTVSQGSVGGRNAFLFTNTGSTATDGVQFQGVSAPIILQAGKRLRMKCAVYMDTATQEFSFGVAAMDTSVIASASTDLLKMEKLTTETAWSFKARKTSGTAVSWPIPQAVAAAHWYDMEMNVVVDTVTAGKGVAFATHGQDVIAGATLPFSAGQLNIATQLPDTVALAPFMAWRAGSAANVNCYVAYLGWIIEG